MTAGEYISEFFQYLINGLAQGSIYALIALGYTMVYGILKLINFAHGEFYMVGGFLGMALMSLLPQYIPIPPVILLPLVLLLTGLLAVFVEYLAYRPLRNSKRLAPLITAVGVSIVLLELIRVIAGGKPQPFPQLFENRVFEVAGLFLQRSHLVIFIVMITLMLLLRWIVMKTPIGRAMRAASQDFDAAKLMGVPLNRVISFTFFLGAVLAAVAGILVGMHFNNVEPYMGQLAGLKAFTAAVLGGIGSVPGAVLGAITLGVCEAFVVGYGESSYRDAIAFGVLILVLMFRPWGILGKPERVKV
jgi:branched-chain amino acid transport system permease protein